ncbi:MAG: RadC family protein [Geminicoccaceae bacterium]
MVDPAGIAAAALAGVGLEISPDSRPDGGQGYAIRGDTFPHRDLLKAHGGRWSKSRRAWIFDDCRALEQLSSLLSHGDQGEAVHGAPGFAEPLMQFRRPAVQPTAQAPRKPHYHGHRQRLRDRFLAGGADEMPDYELLELLLFFGIRYIDVKPLAKHLLAEFGSFGGLLAAEPERLKQVMRGAATDHAEQVEKDCHFAITMIKATQQLMTRALAEKVQKRPVVASWEALLDYLKVALGHEPIEQFRVLFLDKKNTLIKDEVQQQGTVDHTPLYPREIAKRALELFASAVIMVHNHPSGDPTPSRADIEMTRQVASALAPIRIILHDHLIIGQTRHLSFKSEGLI